MLPARVAGAFIGEKDDTVADEERTWTQVDGYDTEFVLGRVAALDPAQFRATVRAVTLDRVRIEVVRSASHRYVRTPEHLAATEERIVTLLVVAEGTCVGMADGTPIEAVAGDVLVFDSTLTIDVTWTAPVRVLRCMIAARHLPAYLLEGPPLPIGVLPRTALINSTIAFVSALMLDDAAWPRTPQLVQALADLTVEVLSEVRGVLAHEPGREGLRFRIEELVMSRLSDPELSPGTIAEALGVSLRSVHHAFEGDEMTVARLIRDRRLDAVANELRDRVGSVQVGQLAQQHGFGSRDQLARSFRQRYGSTMREFRANAGRES